MSDIELASKDYVDSKSGSGSSEPKYSKYLVMIDNGVSFNLPWTGDMCVVDGITCTVEESYYDMFEDAWRIFAFSEPVSQSTAQKIVWEGSFNNDMIIKDNVVLAQSYGPQEHYIKNPFPFKSGFFGLS